MKHARMNTTLAQRKFGVILALFLVAITAALVPSAISAPGDVEQRVEAILSKMTLEQKIDMIGGEDDFYIRAYPELGLPRSAHGRWPHRSAPRRPCHHDGRRHFHGGFVGSGARR